MKSGSCVYNLTKKTCFFSKQIQWFERLSWPRTFIDFLKIIFGLLGFPKRILPTKSQSRFLRPLYFLYYNVRKYWVKPNPRTQDGQQSKVYKIREQRHTNVIKLNGREDTHPTEHCANQRLICTLQLFYSYISRSSQSGIV